MAPPPSPSPDVAAASTPELDAAAAAPSLPTDAIFEILSRAPIKSLCRFRCASRDWRALIADPAFLAMHKSRAGPPHLLAARYSGINHVGLRLMDLDGKVLRETKVVISSFDRPYRLSLFDSRICLLEGCSLHAHMVDVATGEVLVTAQKLNQITSWPIQRNGLRTLIGAGHAALSGKLKVVRLSECFVAGGGAGLEQVCEVLKVDRGAAGGGDRCWWRHSHSPPTEAGKPRPLRSAATVDGVVHFLTTLGNVLRFDLETEQWRKTVRGPPVDAGSSETRITELNGALCMVARRPRGAAEERCIDIWRLADPENSTWVNAYTIATDCYLMPLMVTPDGGKLLFSAGPPLTWTSPAVRLYDLGDKTWNVRRMMADEILVGLVTCSLHLEHFLV